MLSNHVMSKGIKTVDLDSPMKGDGFKLSLITEELLFMRIVNNHKTLVFFLVLFHVSLISICLFSVF